MKKMLIGSLVVMSALLFTAGKASASFIQCPDFSATLGGYASCAYLITINADGTTTVAADLDMLDRINRDVIDPEDVLFGVQNNSLLTIGSLHVVGGLVIDPSNPPDPPENLELFAFDGDFGLTNGPTTYEGPGVFFFNIVPDPIHNEPYIGDVGFSGGLASGASAYFGLEGAAQVDGRPIPITVTAISVAAPEPASLALLLTGLGGLLARRGWRRS